MKNIVIKDSRLTENVRYGSDCHVFRVAPIQVFIYWAWKRIRNYANYHGKLRYLIVECHGIVGAIRGGITANAANICIDPGECIEFGGIGLLLCSNYSPPID